MKPRTPPSRIALKIRLLQRGYTSLGQIAEPLGVTREAVSRVLHGHDRTPRIRKALVEAFGWSERKLWPDAPGRKPAPALAKEAVA